MKEPLFKSNQKYFTITVYTVAGFTLACFIFQIIVHWASTIQFLQGFLTNMFSFVIGILIAFMVNPLVKYVHSKLKKKLNKENQEKTCKMLSILISYVIVLGFIAVVMTYIIPQLITSINELSNRLPYLYTTFSDWFLQLPNYVKFLNQEMLDTMLSNISPKIMELSTNIASEVIPWLYSASMAIVRWFVTLVFAIVISIYLISDKKIIVRAIKKVMYALFSVEATQRASEIAKNCNEIFTGYIIAKSIDSLIIGCLCFLIMSILNLPYSILISVIVGVTNMIPYFGPYIGAIPGILILCITRFRYGIEFTVLIIILQQFDGLILGPRILGDSTGLRPLLILFAIIFGGAYFGVIGMFIGVPIIAVIQYLFTLLIDSKLAEKGITEVK